MIIFTCTIGIVLTVLFLLYRKRCRQKQILKEMGVPGPHTEAHWLFGNVLYPKNKYLQITEWTKQYGKTYGFYEGARPWIVTSDLDFLNEMLIKQFANFTARMEMPIGPSNKDKSNTHMWHSSGAEWKRLRMIINPTFSSAKLKQVNTLLGPMVDTLISNMEKSSNEDHVISINELYQRFTMDVIADVAFGLNTDSQNNPDNPFLKKSRLVFKSQENLPSILKLSGLFPELRSFITKLLMTIGHLVPTPHGWISDQFRKVVEYRRKFQIERHDLLQLLMDAQVTTSSNDTDDVDLKSESPTSQNIKKTLTDMELQKQAILFFLAGYETSSSSLIYLSYLLAVNPDKQKLLREEIDEHVRSNEDITYDLVMKLPYLDMCVLETLRIYPVGASVVYRSCTKACTIQGIHIPENTQMLADVWSIQHDPEIYPEPWKFLPERFSAENRKSHHPLQFLAFGAGPRNCVGQRFGLMEIKRAMVQIMKRFTLEKCELTKTPLQLKEGGAITPADNVYIKLLPRE